MTNRDTIQAEATADHERSESRFISDAEAEGIEIGSGSLDVQPEFGEDVRRLLATRAALLEAIEAPAPDMTAWGNKLRILAFRIREGEA